MPTDQMTDAELAAQPAAYWTGVAYQTLIAFTRAQQAEHGFTQPQFWLLRNLSPNDIAPDGQGRTIPQLEEAMASYLRPEDDLHAEAEALRERGWISRDSESRLSITEAGEQARLRMKSHAPAIRARIHSGIDDADYVTALKVLLQMIKNTEQHAG
ncbi:MarR family winged helix-turn-helix transcriptional regulator [Micromonospora musae]|uniref:MarR family winged helix-turn-helix transcriptional regulator n=1 Tax=Micromonospora musae TaxID=1894970 RepID=UPI00340E4F8F